MTLAPEIRRELHDLLGQLRDGGLGDEGLARLDRLVAGDPAARRFYLNYVDLCAALHWANEKEVVDGQWSVAGGQNAAVSSPQPLASNLSSNPQSPIPNPSFIPPIVITPASPHTPLFSLNSPVGNFLFAYSASAVVLCVAIFLGWAIKMSSAPGTLGVPSRGDTAFTADNEKRSAPPTFVGRVTGLVDCQWSDPKSTDRKHSAVRIGRTYALSAGFLELTYDSGAKVILQGPCVYRVDSARGGYLEVGKLTARVEKKGAGGSGQWSVVSGQNSGNSSPQPLASSPSSNPQSLIPNPLFAITTPTAIVIDLGTEFGVEVEKSGTTRSHVFRGRVQVRSSNSNSNNNSRGPTARGDSALPAGASGNDQVVELTANQSATVEAGQGGKVKLIRGQGSPIPTARTFVRYMPKRVPIKFFNSGVGLREGELDAHWQIIARSDDPTFKPRHAVVTRPLPRFEPLQPTDSRFISTSRNPARAPGSVTFTYRTTFDLTGMLPKSAEFMTGVISDNKVTDIRLNGKSVQGVRVLDYVEGINTLDFDVRGCEVGSEASEGDVVVAIRTLLEGSALLVPNEGDANKKRAGSVGTEASRK